MTSESESPGKGSVGDVMNADELQKFLNEVLSEMEAAGEISLQEPVEILVRPKPKPAPQL